MRLITIFVLLLLPINLLASGIRGDDADMPAQRHLMINIDTLKHDYGPIREAKSIRAETMYRIDTETASQFDKLNRPVN